MIVRYFLVVRVLDWRRQGIWFPDPSIEGVESWLGVKGRHGGRQNREGI
jgi:hypothetical protein